jgi:hypothetical protein
MSMTTVAPRLEEFSALRTHGSKPFQGGLQHTTSSLQFCAIQIIDCVVAVALGIGGIRRDVDGTLELRV